MNFTMNNCVIMGTVIERISDRYMIIRVKGKPEEEFNLDVFIPFGDNVNLDLLKEGNLVGIKGSLMKDTIYGVMLKADKLSFLSKEVQENVNI